MRVKNCAFFALLLILSGSSLCAQKGYVPADPITPVTVQPPKFIDEGDSVVAPVVTAPTAPTMSTGSLSTPSAQGAKTVSVTETTGADGKTHTLVDNSALTGKKATTTAPAATAAKTASPKTSASALSLLGLGSDNSFLKALSGSGSDSGSLDALSSILGGKASSSSSSADSATLNKILSLLEKQEAQSPAANTTAVATAGKIERAQSEKAPISSGGELVHFTVNGYNIAPTVTTVVSSILARDGSFLLTGDRTYLSSNRYRNETFYLLCRKTGKETYRLFADVSQDSINTYSFLYKLSRKTPLEGRLTGDLIVFRTNDAALKLDLVIRVIAPTAEGSLVR